MYKLRYSPRFDMDMQRLKMDILGVSFSSETADKYVKDFITKIENKKSFPHSGSRVYYGDHFTGLYYIHFKAYNAFYRVRGDYMEVLRILPSKSDYLRILIGEYYPEDLISEDISMNINESIK